MTFKAPLCALAVTLALGCDLTPMPDDEDAMGSSSGDASGEQPGESEADAGSAEGGELDGGDESTGGEDCGESEGSTGHDSDTAPELEITLPAMDLPGAMGPEYDGYDEERGLWYVNLEIAATASDAEDGDLSEAIEWTTDQGAVQNAILGTGASATVRLYSDECFGTVHTLTAAVVDEDGNEVTAERIVNIWALC